MNKAIERLESVRQRIKKACITVGRQHNEVSLLAVSKRHTASEIRFFQKLDVLSFGENQLQEALIKQAQLTDLDIQWHFIGTIQSNKTRAIAENFQWVQSVDREKILKRLSVQRPSRLPPLNVCLQVNIDQEPQKAGASPEEILQLATLTKGLNNISLRGLMAIPKMTGKVSDQCKSFRKLARLFETLKDTGHEVDTLSMGMSLDLETAIGEGSTMVRVGTDLFGKRDP